MRRIAICVAVALAVGATGCTSTTAPSSGPSTSTSVASVPADEPSADQGRSTGRPFLVEAVDPPACSGHPVVGSSPGRVDLFRRPLRAARTAARPGERVSLHERLRYLSRYLVRGPGGPRLVVTVRESHRSAWYAAGVTPCAPRGPVGPSCGSVVRWHGQTYEADVGEPQLGPGAIVGEAVIPRCATISTPDGRLYRSETALSPTVYGSSHPEPGLLILVVNGRPVGYERVG